MEYLDANHVIQIFKQLQQVMTARKDNLTEIDEAVGDGDLGLTMQKGFDAAIESIQSLEEQDTGMLIMKAGMSIDQEAPATMGSLLGSGFMAAGKALKGITHIGTPEMAEFMDSMVQGIMKSGKANPGEKTIIDSLMPAAEALKSAMKNNLALPEALKQGYKAAAEGLEATKQMIPQHGKQVIHREKSLGLPDPGAIVGVYIIRTFYEYVYT